MTAAGILEPVAANRSVAARAGEHRHERALLVAAAERVIAGGGLGDLTVRDVCREARFSVHRFYHHFESKTDLIAALLEQQMMTAADYLAAAVGRAGPPAVRVRTYAVKLIGFAFDKRLEAPTLLFALQSRTMLVHYQCVFDRCVGKILGPLVVALTDGNQDGSLWSPDPQADAMAVFYLIMGLIFDQPSSGAVGRRMGVERTVLSFAERGLRLRSARAEATTR